MRKFILATAAVATVVLPALPAAADGRGHGHRKHHYRERVITRHDRVWRGDDGRYYCKRDNGTTGLVIGAAAGALLGREVDGGRDRTVGTIIGAAAGGLLGREIDRGDLKCR